MKKEDIQILIDEGKSIREISNATNKSFSTVRYWLKKYDIKTHFNEHNTGKKFEIKGSLKYCPRCNEYKDLSLFYFKYKSKNDYLSTYCKKCWNILHVERLQKIKIRMIEYKGSKCVKCGLDLKDTHPSVFDFHHTNPEEKDIDFIKMKRRSFEKIKPELDKCILLCSNCHRIIHSYTGV